MNTKTHVKTTAISISAFLILVMTACLLYLLLVPRTYDGCVAQIYQNGQLITSIPLDEIQDPYIFEVENTEGGLNRIKVQPGSIGVIWADCPDQLCVHQGFAETPTIPITCLPNRLVIQLRPAHTPQTDSAEPDAITY